MLFILLIKNSPACLLSVYFLPSRIRAVNFDTVSLYDFFSISIEFSPTFGAVRRTRAGERHEEENGIFPGMTSVVFPTEEQVLRDLGDELLQRLVRAVDGGLDDYHQYCREHPD